MARRSELKVIAYDLLASFVSRNNDLDGYWALGFFQAYLQDGGPDVLLFDLLNGTCAPDHGPFRPTAAYYRTALLRQMAARKMPASWVVWAQIKVTSVAEDALSCQSRIVSDLGHRAVFDRRLRVFPHLALNESKRGGQHGPQNRWGI